MNRGTIPDLPPADYLHCIGPVLRGQLRRPPRAVSAVAAWCPYGFPAVIESLPYLPDGTPFPTTLYLTCPTAVDAAGRLESAGGVADLRRRIVEDADWREAFRRLEKAYRVRRRLLYVRHRRSGSLPADPIDGGAVLRAGIGGPTPPEKVTCLHTVLAAVLGLAPGAAEDEPLGDFLTRYGDLWCRDVRCASFLGNSSRYAAVDVGTNSVRVLVADVEEGSPPVAVVRRARITRLGEGVGRDGFLTEGARRRTLEAVTEYVHEARRRGAQRVLLAATSAAREAADGPDFTADLGHRLGVKTVVLSGETEARLSYTGATLEVSGHPTLIDVGGGSTELVRRESEPVSFPLGAVRATERWVRSDPPADGERAAIREEAARAFAGMGSHPGDVLVGVAGTVTTLACLVLDLEQYDPAAIHLLEVSRADLSAQVDRLAAMTETERAALSCMQPGREKVIVAGGEILVAAMETLGFDGLTVSERDILDGLVLAAAGAGPPDVLPDVLLK